MPLALSLCCCIVTFSLVHHQFMLLEITPPQPLPSASVAVPSLLATVAKTTAKTATASADTKVADAIAAPAVAVPRAASLQIPILKPFLRTTKSLVLTDEERRTQARTAVVTHLSRGLFHDQKVKHTVQTAGRGLNVKFDVSSTLVSLSKIMRALQQTKNAVMNFVPHSFSFVTRNGQPVASLSIQGDYLLSVDPRRTDMTVDRTYDAMQRPESMLPPTSASKRKVTTGADDTRSTKRLKTSDSEAAPVPLEKATDLSIQDIMVRFDTCVDVIKTKATMLLGDRTPVAVKATVTKVGRTVEIEVTGYDSLASNQLCPFLVDIDSLLSAGLPGVSTTSNISLDFERRCIRIAVSYQ